MISSADIDAIEQTLFDPVWSDDAWDFFALHGAITAFAVGPEPMDTRKLFTLATGVEQEPPESFVSAVKRIADSLTQELGLGNGFELPEPEEGDPMDALANWCGGFVEVFLGNEDLWLEVDEDGVGEQLVPIFTLSGLFEDEEFEQARNNERVSQRMVDALPEAITDLYLTFHSPS